MVYVDIIISIFIIYGFGKGLYRGFVREVASVVGLGLGVYMANKFNIDLSDFLLSVKVFNWHEEYVNILSNVILFTLTILFVSILGKSVTKLMKLVALGVFNRLLGAIFGLLKNVLILTIVVFMLNLTNNYSEIIEQNKLELSVYYKTLNDLSEIGTIKHLEE